MAIFVGTHVNKVDRKERVSVPAEFRAWLGKPPNFFAFPSLLNSGVECCTAEVLETFGQKHQGLDLFISEERDNIADLIYASCHSMAVDRDGRVVLPEKLKSHAGLEGKAVFVGKGETFQIWEPSKHEKYQIRARERSEADRLTLRQRPQMSGQNPDVLENGT